MVKKQHHWEHLLLDNQRVEEMAFIKQKSVAFIPQY